MQVQTLRSILQIESDEWNSIVGRNRLICRHEYLAAVEESEINDCRFFYPVVYDDGRIVAHACAYAISTELDTFAQGPVKRCVQRIRGRLPRFLVMKSLECGTPVALGNTISFRSCADQGAILPHILGAVEAVARDRKIPVVVWRDFREDEIEFCNPLLRAGYRRVRNLPGASIKISWRSLDDYFRAMRRRYRRRAQAHRAKFSRDGISVELLEDFRHLAGKLAELWTNVYDAAREYRRERLTESFFRNMSDRLGPRSAVLLVRKDGRPVAFSLLLLDDETLTPLFCGLDYLYNRDYCLYLNLFYEILDLAMRRGFRDVDFGITTLETKKETGAEVEPLYVYMKHLNPVLNFFVPRIFEMLTPGDTSGAKRVFKSEQIAACP